MSRKKQEELPVKVFNFTAINASMEGLQFNVQRDLKKRSIAAKDEKTGAGLLLMRIAVLFGRQLYDSIRFLCSDEETKGRRPEYIFAVPSITRTLQEILFTIMYIGEDFPNRADKYYKASWRERVDERSRYCNEHSTKAEWRPFLRNYKQALKEGAEQIKLTQEESKKTQLIELFPIGMRLLESMDKPNRPFAKWMETWFYRETSAIAHFTPLGTVKIAGYMIHDMVPQADSKERSAESLRRFAGFHIMMATIVILAMASELEHMFNLGNRDQIVGIWEKIRLDFPDAIEVCTRRYDKLLRMR